MPRRLRAVLKAKGRWAKLRGDFVIHPELALPFLTGLVTLVLPLVLPPTIAPLQTLHMDVWGPARVSGQDRERYFMMVVDDYTRYTTIFPLLRKGEVPDVLIHWIRAVRLQLRERFREDLPVVRLHSDRGVMEVARTSMIHAAALHFLWPFAGSRAFVRDTSADKLFSRTILCVFLGFPADAPGWQFYHPTLRHVLPSQDATFDESFPFYRLFPYCTAPLPPPPPLFLAPGPPQIDHLPPQGPAPSYVSQVDPLPETVLVEVAVYSGTARGAASGGAEPEDASSGGAEPKGTAYAGGPAGAGGAGATSLVGAGAAGPGGARTRGTGAAGVGGVGGAGARGSGVGDPGVGGAGAGGTGAGGIGAGGAGAGGAGAGGAGGVDPRAGVAGNGGAASGGTRAVDPGARGAGAGGAASGGTGAGGTVQRHPFLFRRHCCLCRHLNLSFASGPLTPRPPPVPGTHVMALRPSSVPLRVPLPPPLESSLTAVPDPESNLACGASPTVTRLLATAVTDPSFESTAASALVAELVDLAAACCLDYATSFVAQSESDCPPSVGGECALGTDVLEDSQEDFECRAAAVPHLVAMLLALEGDQDAPDIPTPRSYAEAIEGPYSSQWQTAMDAEMASWKLTGTYHAAVPPSGANIVDGMWIFRVKRPPGSPPVFKARYIARGFSQRQGRDYELHSLDFSTTFLQGSLHEEIWLRRPPGFTGSFPAGTQWSLRRPVYGLRQAPREWHDTLRTMRATLGFAASTADPSLFLRTDTSLPPFYALRVARHTEALTLVKSELQKRHICTDLGELRSYLGLQITRD
ncbi:unnamed protein product [Closterium sp. NIES-54]